MKIIITIVFSLHVFFVFAQTVEYAATVLEYSSQFSAKKFSANEILGRPTLAAEGVFLGTTWCPAENVKDAFIKVGFKQPMNIRQVAIFEFANANTITEVIAFDTDGKSHSIYKNAATDIHINKRTLRIDLKLTSYKVSAIRINCDFRNFPAGQRCHLDAVAISDDQEPVEAKINLSSNATSIPGIPIHLGTNINSTCDELLPLISSDGTLMVFVRYNCFLNKEGAKGDSGDAWYSEYVNGVWSPAKNMDEPISNHNDNAVASISPDGNSLMIFGKYNNDGTSNAYAGLSLSHRTKEGWSLPELMNIRNFYTQTKVNNFFLAADWRTLILCVERDDSRGEADMYVSFREGDDAWTEPKHLGPMVNTASLEFSPFLAPDGVTLYFSSWGLPGYGQCDMFVTKRLDDTWQNWSEPVNMGPAINTPYFDSYYKITADGKQAYYVTSQNSLGGGDIFAMELPQELKPEPVVLIKGTVINAKTKQPLTAKIKYEVLTTGKESGETQSNPLTGYYSIVLPYGNNYGYYAVAPGYVAVNENLDLSAVKNYQELTQNILLLPIEIGQTIQLNNVFFVRSQATLLAESYPELERLAKLMRENALLEIELRGHTDNTGSESANLKLSQGRVAAVKAYLESRGIQGKRISGKGFGGTKPLMPNTTEENKRKNRRVEFVITKG